MTTLLTGAAGFIGTYVRRKLEAAGERVLTVDSLEPRVHAAPRSDIDFVGHVRDTPYSMVAQCDTIVHLAAQVGVADSAIDPLRYVHENTLETTEFLLTLGHALRNGNTIRKLVVASSMSVYGDPRSAEPISEAQPIAPASVYGLTKYDQERLALLWGAQHGVDVAALRFFNVYGPGQALKNPYTGVLANFANWLLNGEHPIVYEDGLQTRDFVYVEDVADAVTLAALTPASGVFNVATGAPTTIIAAAEFLAQHLNANILPHVTGTMRVGDIRHCIGDASALRSLGWTPKVSFAEGLERYAKALQ